ncbi:hypothetical protein GCM10027416_28610 [Okibacterium endophyticum]
MHPSPARPWASEVGAGVVVAVMGLLEAWFTAASGYGGSVVPYAIALAMGLATGLVRQAGWASFVIVWVAFAVQVASVTDIMVIELAVIAIAFGFGRWGSKPLLWASGLSIPVATFLALGYVAVLADGIWATRIARNLIVPLDDGGVYWPIVVLPMIAGVLAVPWLAGLVVRYSGAARASRESQSRAEAEALTAQRESAQMHEIATLREGQARLARDVHDVVGHSLTVILAQAESAQFLDRADTAALKRTMSNIATSARSSLHEVRAVLASPDGAAGYHSDLDTLIEGTRASGSEIAVTDTGTPRPLPPELATVAFRVLQEMLTNAIKHGRRGGSIAVARDWGDTLRITVTNDVDDGADASAALTMHGGGNGIEGMRRRLESVGGRLDVLQTGGAANADATRSDATSGDAQAADASPASSLADGATVTASAWLPVRSSRITGTVMR